MGPDQAAQWKSEVLDHVFAALAANRTLAGRLIFKGARVLSRRLGSDDRQSLDLDMNLTMAFVREYPDREAQREVLRADMHLALSRYFSEQPVVRFEVVGVTVQPVPSNGHPLGWNAFAVRVVLRDLANLGVRGVPTIELDIATPELLGPNAAASLSVGGHDVVAYTLERIAGEKLRAFLTSLPAYRQKLRRPGTAIRVKDLYDLARVERVHPLSSESSGAFWREVAEEFRLACRSRFVDCAGMETFADAADVTRATYAADATIPRDNMPFDSAWAVLTAVVHRLEAIGVFPLLNPLPTPVGLEAEA